MANIRTFIDTGVLIYAFQGIGDLATNALAILDDPQRDFIVSDFVKLELLPKPTFNNFPDQVLFYQTFFAGVKRTVRASRTLVEEAQHEAEQAGLSALDALHVAAAKRANCDELVTAEKPTKLLCQITSITVRSIRPAPA